MQASTALDFILEMGGDVAFEENVGDILLVATTNLASRGNVHPKAMEPMICFNPFMVEKPKEVLDLVGNVAFQMARKSCLSPIISPLSLSLVR